MRRNHRLVTALACGFSLALLLIPCAAADAGVSYKTPAGGWLYEYDGSGDDNDELAALDGGWTHDLNDRWDGSGPGEAGTSPGGVKSFTEGDVTYLRIQDTGDPRGLGIDDAISNRKMTFNRDIVALDNVSDAYLDEGLTFSFRARLSTTAPLDNVTFDGSDDPWPDGGRGMDIDFDGTGFFMFMQRGGDNPGPISFSLADPEFGMEDLVAGGLVEEGVGGLLMNNLVEDFPDPQVDSHEAFDEDSVNFVPIDNLTDWHEFWITIQASQTGTGTHTVDVYVDGATDPLTHEVTIGSANRDETATLSPSYTSAAIAYDLDFYAFSEGVILPESLGGGALPRLQPGDADRDLDFDQLDLVQVQIAAKYLSGQPATWGEGDWDGGPGGSQAEPPVGSGQFDQLDIIAALNAGVYLTGPYAAIAPNGTAGDAQTSVIYNPGTGEVAVDAPAGTELTSINIDSAGGIFTGAAALNLGGSFDNDADNNIFKATFGGSFGSVSFGNVAQTGLAQDVVLNDLTVVGSLAGGGDLGNVDLIYVPEPASILFLVVGAVNLIALRKRSRLE